ncbi:MAG TPA: hypothetical protein VMZ74_07220 [Ramlibacter sp.]|nr:hypothetical protein [Ramlibacter sp.]
MAGSSEAQGNGRNGRNQGVPPGQMPPAGMCRVWYDNLPPGRQPRATSCDQAERLASRNRNARVIYGDSNYGNRNNDQRYRDRGYGNTNPNDRSYGNTYPATNGRYGNNSVAFDNGYRDGLEKGREDAGDRDSYDPVRHGWYRSGDRGYNNRYGTRDSYKLTYREGFEAGYDQAYRQLRGYGTSAVRRY